MYNQYPNNSGQLNGWFGRQLKRLIVKVATFVDAAITTNTAGFVDSNFTEFANMIGEGGSSFWNRGSVNEYDEILFNLQNDPRGFYEPTASEEFILDKFSDELAMILEHITTQLVLLENTVFNAQKLNALNLILQRVAILKSYYKVSETTNLSKPAILLRDLLIETMVIPILKGVAKQMSSQLNYEKVQVTTDLTSGAILTELEPFKKRAYISFTAIFEIYQLKQITIGNDDVDLGNNNTDTGNNTGTGNNSVPDNNTTSATSGVKKLVIGVFGGLLLAKILK